MVVVEEQVYQEHRQQMEEPDMGRVLDKMAVLHGTAAWGNLIDREILEAGHHNNSMDKWEEVANLMEHGPELDLSRDLKHLVNQEPRWQLNQITMLITNTINNMPNNFPSNNSSMQQHMLPGNNNISSKQEIHSKGPAKNLTKHFKQKIHKSQICSEYSSSTF